MFNKYSSIVDLSDAFCANMLDILLDYEGCENCQFLDLMMFYIGDGQ